ncbi:LTA synthase family protein [Tenuibacillus multivorans]|uniref:Phosphoglycerol transferase MdoB n=1 Tax=Tenuibacillus multivorans TaxID=237069 RepID=A0A1G9X653_9BACI|nr:LTA synthase family protein [Tenuibacillus multivorans]GEL78651.1 sulfatase [Tenuibacillus multivorans]SDM92172.1 Phosphoglycerol transferase MdoB [Tenuibacillus multivorans]
MNILKNIGFFVLRHIEIPILASLLFIKMVWFAQETGIYFMTTDRIMVNMGQVILLFSIGLLFTRVRRLLAFFLISLIGAFIVYADLVYFRYFGDFITTPVLAHSTQMGDISSSITELMNWSDLKYFFDVILVLAAYIFLKVKKVKQYIAWKERLALFMVGLIAGLYMTITPIQNYVDDYGTNLFKNTWSNVSVYNVTGHLGFHVFETQKYIDENIINSPELEPGEKDDILAWFDEHHQDLAEKTDYFGTGEGYNVMMIQLESFQDYVVGNSINGKEITPNINDLLDDSYRFTNFYHQVGQGRTSDAEFLTQTSLYPLPTGSVYVRYPTNTFDSMPGYFKENGYSTSVYHSYDKSFWNRSTVYPNYGFDEFIGQGDFEPGETAGPFDSLGDEGVFLQMTEDNVDQQPFYSFVVALTSHHPYTHIPSKYYDLNTDPFGGTIFANYLHSTHYVDYAVGQLVEKMKAEGLWENTILVLYGDHDSGVEFTAEHAQALGLDDDPISLMNVKHKVPLIIRVPGMENQGQSFDHSVGMIDIAPTIMHLMGKEEPPVHFGNNVFDMEDHLVPFRYGSYKKGAIYYDASLDGKIENGTCYNVEEKQELPVEQCADDAQKVRELLQMSDNVIYHNLVNEIKEKTQE